MRKNLYTKFSTRQYMLSRDFEIYYYGDPYDKKVESHSHRYYEFYFFLEGDVSMEIYENRYPLKYGDLVVIPPDVPHHALMGEEDGPYRRFVFWITEDYLEKMAETSEAYGYVTRIAREEGEYIFHNDRITFNAIQTKVFRLIEEIHSNRFGHEAKVALCVSDLLLHLNRVVYDQKHERSPHEERELYENLIDYIEDHLDEELSLERLAKEFYVSKYHIAHVFKASIGMSVHQYIQKKRLEACRDAIRNRARISEAYLMFGFKEYSGFYRSF